MKINVNHYESPEIKIILSWNDSVLCTSEFGAGTEKFTEDDLFINLN